MPINPRLRDLSLKTATHVLRELNSWPTDRVKNAIASHDARESPFDTGVAQFLRLYLGARTIGTVMNEASPYPSAEGGHKTGAGAERPKDS